jgi:hypothetical protein
VCAQDTTYRKFVTINEITFVFFLIFSLPVDSIHKREPLVSKPFGYLRRQQHLQTASPLLPFFHADIEPEDVSFHILFPYFDFIIVRLDIPLTYPRVVLVCYM